MRSLTVARMETTQLFVRLREEGDKDARDVLVERFLPLARKLARRYAGAREPVDDLMQVASLALVKAVDRFDPGRGTAFSSLAVPTILGELKRYFRDLGWSVHVPRGAQEQALRVEQAQHQLSTERGRAPSVSELAEYLELSIEDVLDALETAVAHHSISLEAPQQDPDGEPASLAESIGRYDERFELIDASVTICSAAEQLTTRERHALALRFQKDMTQMQIGAEIGVSQMQVSRILRAALARLREITQNDAEPPSPISSRPRTYGLPRRTSVAGHGDGG
jgi:RNA polymerase sigma-B factor